MSMASAKNRGTTSELQDAENRGPTEHHAFQLRGGREGGEGQLTQIPSPGRRPPERAAGRGYLKPDGIYTPSGQRTPAWLSHPAAANLKSPHNKRLSDTALQQAMELNKLLPPPGSTGCTNCSEHGQSGH